MVIDLEQKKIERALARGRVPLTVPGQQIDEAEVAERIVKLKQQLERINNFMKEIKGGK